MVKVGAATHPGRVRTTNEDFIYHGPTPIGYVGIVCDGMGGHEAGEVAARIAAEAAYKFLCEAQPTRDMEGLLRDAVLSANQQILLRVQAHPQSKAPGSTIVIALIDETHITFAHVGDSRLYMYHKGELTPLTQDDSLVQQMFSSGLITAEQAINHPQKNVLTQSLGQHPAPTPHTKRLPIKKGAIYLLCSDGLSNSLSKEELTTALARAADTPLEEIANLLIQQANANGGYDNISVVLLQPPHKTATFVGRMNLKLPPTKYLIGGGIAIIVVILAVILFTRGRRTPQTTESGEIVITDDTTPSPQNDSTASLTDSELPPSTPAEEISPSTPPPTSNLPNNPPSELPKTSKSTPTTKKPTKTSKENSESSSSNGAVIEYTIQKGDNLLKIAEAFGVSRNEIRKINGLKDDNIKVGKKLKIPVKAVQTHVVGEKETLSGIARKYGTRVEAIKRANGLEDEKIREKQKLIIPILKK
ncbi:MAG: Stp1/IreP family PP2C-type Ser/Thr phosphatase [Bacteroidia bacterium]|nr:Stp1/IreP family PP2C-type Ser/Thr phosphatase [Bacteroidia bacterium]MCX7652926.1 Stp1/IreP family PP2C-type Ser/Thr phosphatase [Bacteroidia bacterium]MDW8416606.1 Stp1/IreP family PP2C-type Ser/Thr phosphatase [Bacteroidia bacterium]